MYHEVVLCLTLWAIAAILCILKGPTGFNFRVSLEIG
jgi:hypothetical protein